MTFTGERRKRADKPSEWRRLRPYALALVLAWVALLWWVTRPRQEPAYQGKSVTHARAPAQSRERQEPAYQGKSVTVWMENLYSETDTRFGGPAGYSQARAAIRAIGEPSISIILARMATRDTPPMPGKLTRALEAVHLMSKPAYFGMFVDEMKRSPRFKRETAVHAFEALGPVAVKAIPDVQTLLACRHPEVRICAMRALATLGTNAAPAVPALSSCLTNDPDGSVRVEAALALTRIEPVPQQLVPVLSAGLSASSPSTRSSCALALGQFGDAANSSIPKLKTLLSDPDPHVAKDAREVLLRLRVPVPTEIRQRN